MSFKQNDWNFVAGFGDQGFLWYMLCIRHDVGVYFRATKSMVHYVLHYWGTIAGAKPWNGKLWLEPAHMEGQCSSRLGANLRFLSQVETRSNGSVCASELERMRTLRRSAELHPVARAGTRWNRCLQFDPARMALF